METFKIPSQPDSEFEIQFFYFISLKIEELASETGKWPDQILFQGRLGNQLFKIIEERRWDFSRFNPTSDPISILNKIIIQYSKPLDQIEDSGPIRGDQLNGKEVNGIPGDLTISRILSNSISLNFKTERSIRPKLEIKLVIQI